MSGGIILEDYRRQDPHCRTWHRIGHSSISYRVGSFVRKTYQIDPDCPESTTWNRQGCVNEADCYTILGPHPHIAKCLRVGEHREYLDLEYYPHESIRSYLGTKRPVPEAEPSQIRKWGLQMIASIVHIHHKGVLHCDLRLEQWLLDQDLNVRLADFDGGGFAAIPHLGLPERLPNGSEQSGYWLPREGYVNNKSTDLFALGSCLYELETGRRPFQEYDEDTVVELFREGTFPSTDGLIFDSVIERLWQERFADAWDVLQALACNVSINDFLYGPRMEPGARSWMAERLSVGMSDHVVI